MKVKLYLTAMFLVSLIMILTCCSASDKTGSDISDTVNTDVTGAQSSESLNTEITMNDEEDGRYKVSIISPESIKFDGFGYQCKEVKFADNLVLPEKLKIINLEPVLDHTVFIKTLAENIFGNELLSFNTVTYPNVFNTDVKLKNVFTAASSKTGNFQYTLTFEDKEREIILNEPVLSEAELHAKADNIAASLESIYGKLNYDSVKVLDSLSTIKENDLIKSYNFKYIPEVLNINLKDPVINTASEQCLYITFLQNGKLAYAKCTVIIANTSEWAGGYITSSGSSVPVSEQKTDSITDFTLNDINAFFMANAGLRSESADPYIYIDKIEVYTRLFGATQEYPQIQEVIRVYYRPADFGSDDYEGITLDELYYDFTLTDIHNITEAKK